MKHNKILIANFKMNPENAAEAIKLAKAMDYKNVVICPPFIFLDAIKKIIKNAFLGVQNIFWGESGAYTGEISSQQAKKFGVKYAIIGHSERRKYLCESDEMIAKKIGAAINAGLIPILAIGESLEERNQNQTFKTIRDQLNINLSSTRGRSAKQLIIAYEPVWAIGVGKSDDPKETMKVIKFIKQHLAKNMPKIKNTKFLYGGSIDSQNITRFLKYDEIDGFLIGGASLKSEEMKKIIAKTAVRK